MDKKLEQIKIKREKEKAEGHLLPQGIEHEYGVAVNDFIIKHNIKNILETGVFHGFSAWYMLLALKETGGHLYSVELNIKDFKDIVVPVELRGSWSIIQGKSPEDLLPVFNRGCGSDLFIHDSKHTYEVQFCEYMMASKFSRYVGSHDIERNRAWPDFLKITNSKIIYSGKRFAICEVGK